MDIWNFVLNFLLLDKMKMEIKYQNPNPIEIEPDFNSFSFTNLSILSLNDSGDDSQYLKASMVNKDMFISERQSRFELKRAKSLKRYSHNFRLLTN
jgi:hypothetical protein